METTWVRPFVTPLLALLGFAAIGCTTSGYTSTHLAEPVVERATAGPYLHEPSGVSFPESVGSARRLRVTRYDVEGRNVSAGYNFMEPGVVLVATVFIYPAPRAVSLGASEANVEDMKRMLAEDAWSGSLAEVQQSHEGLVLVADEEVELVNAGRTYRGRKATMEYVNDFGGMPLQARSYLYQFCWAGGDWIVKYRFTHPIGLDATRSMDAMLHEIRWP